MATKRDYVFFRYINVLKGCVRNHACPERCIAECYLANESAQFCSKYIHKARDIGDKHDINDIDHLVGALLLQFYINDSLYITHTYILFNTSDV